MGVLSAEILYFDTEGEEYQAATLHKAFARARELGLSHLAVASSQGEAGLTALEIAREINFAGQLLVVAEHYGYISPGRQQMSADQIQHFESHGVRVFIGTHVLSGVERSFRQRYGGIFLQEIIAATLRCLSNGTKVGIEMALMLADAGWVPVDRDIVVVAGGGGGTDTALVVRPATTNDFFNLKVREVLTLPRARLAEAVSQVVRLYERGSNFEEISIRTGYLAKVVQRYISNYEAVKKAVHEGEDLDQFARLSGLGFNSTRMYAEFASQFGAEKAS